MEVSLLPSPGRGSTPRVALVTQKPTYTLCFQCFLQSKGGIGAYSLNQRQKGEVEVEEEEEEKREGGREGRKRRRRRREEDEEE